jgi:PKD domain
VTNAGCIRSVALRCLLLLSAALGIVGAGPQEAVAAPADFSWSPDPPVVNRQMTFNAAIDPSIVAYAWDLNDNGSYSDATGPQIRRTFRDVKSYEIGLETVDDQGAVSHRRKTVTVVADSAANRPPEASFVFFPAGPVAGELVTFVSTSTDADSPIPASALDWDLNGDGVFDDAEGPSATTSYPVAGTYTISLRIATNKKDVATLVLNVGAPGIPGTGVGQKTFSLMSPFPVVRISGQYSRRGVRIRRLTIDASPGTGVGVQCGGRGCPFERLRRTISLRVRANRELPPKRLLRIRSLEGRLLRPGVKLRLFVTRPNAVGKYTRFEIRRRKSPSRTDMCLVPGSTRPVSCPSR